MTDLMSWTTTSRTSAQYGRVIDCSQARRSDNKISNGHTFGDTVLHAQASAHFGDSYTSYHIYNPTDHAKFTTTGSLTITAALADILTISAQIKAYVSMLWDPPPTLVELRDEFEHLKIVLSSLQKFIDDSSENPDRASLIELEDVVTVMTQLVLLYPEIQVFLHEEAKRMHRRWHSPSTTKYVGWRLLSRLRGHISTLSIVLQILQCHTDRAAQDQAICLNRHTNYELQRDHNLAGRLSRLEHMLHLEPIKNAGGEAALLENRLSNALLETNPAESTAGIFPPPGKAPQAEMTCSQRNESRMFNSDEPFFGTVLAQSRAYRKNEHREVDGVSTRCSTTRSHGWSMLSGLSASQVTCVGVVCLPLDDSELVCWQRCLPIHTMVDHSSQTGYLVRNPELQAHPRHHLETRERPILNRVIPPLWSDLLISSANLSNHPYLKRIKQEVLRNGYDYLFTGICVTSVGHDMTHWQATIEGPTGTPFEGGLFCLKLEFPPEYPFSPPKCIFTTRIYHPNVNEEGQISLNSLRNGWKPTLKISTVLLGISSLLDNPDLENPLVRDIACIYMHDRAAYDARARVWTRLYAKRPAIPQNNRILKESLQIDTAQSSHLHGHKPTQKPQRSVEFGTADKEV